MPLPKRVEILMAIADGLGYAHRHSIIHRDIKPANIRVLEDGSVKIMDFGIAKSLATASNLTQTGITLGTSAYLAPEQIRGEPLDGRTDIFALGILAYELLTYRKPFRGEHLSTLLYRILNESPEPVHAVNPEVPASLSATVAKAIEKNAANRYPTMETLHQELVSVYRQMTGASARLRLTPQMTEGRTTRVTEPFDPDATVRTPSKGMPTTQITPTPITPPSGALARAPAPIDATPPPGATAAPARGGLEVVNFRDPSQREISRRTSTSPVEPARGSRGLWIGAAVVVAILAAGGAGWYLRQGRQAALIAPAPAPVATTLPAVATPGAFPQPVVGVDAPEAKPTVAEAAPAAPKPAKKYPVQFSSVPMATFFVDGAKIGPSVPARTLSLSEGPHIARFEAADLDPGEERFTVGPHGTPRVNYMFPVGVLVIASPAWSGANILVDNKFKGVLSGEKRFRLKAGTYRVTLSREGVNPVTAEITVPKGGSNSWNPPPPSAIAPGGGA